MDITKIKESQEKLREAEKELERMVKEYLKKHKEIKPIFSPGKEYFAINFLKYGLCITAEFQYSYENGNYACNNIICEQWKIFFEPVELYII